MHAIEQFLQSPFLQFLIFDIFCTEPTWRKIIGFPVYIAISWDWPLEAAWR